MTYTIDILERCLRAWEDYWFLLELLEAANPSASKRLKNDAMVNHRAFRLLLLQRGVSRLGSDELVDLTRFLPPADIAAEVPPTFANLPCLIASWSVHSRRIYSMSAELQAVLRSTSIHRMRWADLSLPFPAFGIQLEQPIRDPDGEEFSLVFLNSVETTSGTAWAIQTLSNRCLEYQPLAQHQRQQLEQKNQRGKQSSLRQAVEGLFSRFGCIGGYSFGLQAADRSELVVRTVERLARAHNLSEGTRHAFDRMTRMVVGLTLYLKALPAGSPHLSAWTKRHLPDALDLRAVTREAELCAVSSLYKLSPEERDHLGLNGEPREHPELALATHFRSAHWRRARGTGGDPNAPKVERVRWTIVRRDRLPATGGLPRGTIQVL